MCKNMKTPEQRKNESMAYLNAKGVNVIDHLPILETESEFKIRSAQDAAKRIICLVFVTDFASGDADESYMEYIKTHSLQSWFTPEEWNFINTQAPDQQLKINMSWRIEAAYFLLWALGRIKSLPFPTEMANPGDVYSCLPPFDKSPHEYVNNATIIPKEDILDKADLIYRMHWATRQAYIEQQEAPSDLEGGVVSEWHHAVNWLAYIADENWDDVSTNT